MHVEMSGPKNTHTLTKFTNCKGIIRLYKSAILQSIQHAMVQCLDLPWSAIRNGENNTTIDGSDCGLSLHEPTHLRYPKYM